MRRLIEAWNGRPETPASYAIVILWMAVIFIAIGGSVSVRLP